MMETIEKEHASEQSASDASVARDDFRYTEMNEFSYRPVPLLAVIGIVLALLSSISVIFWLAIPLCLIGFLTSSIALIVIRRNREVYSGTLIATLGVLLSAGFGVGSVAYQINLYQNEVPEGYERYSFVKDISDKGFVTVDGLTDVHPDIKALDGKKVFIKGYIYQTGRMTDLQSFLFVKDNQSCCFGAKPALNDRMGIVMQDGKSIDYKAGKVAIAGTFRLNPKFTNEELDPVFMIEGDYFSAQVSDF